jgi:hypothetical protein
MHAAYRCHCSRRRHRRLVALCCKQLAPTSASCPARQGRQHFVSKRQLDPAKICLLCLEHHAGRLGTGDTRTITYPAGVSPESYIRTRRRLQRRTAAGDGEATVTRWPPNEQRPARGANECERKRARWGSERRAARRQGAHEAPVKRAVASRGRPAGVSGTVVRPPAQFCATMPPPVTSSSHPPPATRYSTRASSKLVF